MSKQKWHVLDGESGMNIAARAIKSKDVIGVNTFSRFTATDPPRAGVRALGSWSSSVW